MRPIRWLTSLVVAVVMVLGLVVVAAPGAKSAGTTISIHKLSCPVNTGDIFGTCHHVRLANVSFTVGGGGGTKSTNASGEVTFTLTSTGNITITEKAASVTANGVYAYCSIQNQNRKVLIDRRDANGAFTIAVAAGNQIHCDIYNLTAPLPPPPATIFIHKLRCPANTADIFGQCHHVRVANVSFTVGGGGGTKSTNASGEVTFTLTGTGNITITENPASVTSKGVYTYCSIQNQNRKVLIDRRDADGAFTIAVAAGNQIHCDIYNLT